MELVYTPEGGQPQKMKVFDFKNGGGVTMAMYNTDESIRSFAHSSFQVWSNFLPKWYFSALIILKLFWFIDISCWSNIWIDNLYTTNKVLGLTENNDLVII